jgi:hypothetical protein
VVHEVRNVETGERYRIVDHRPRSIAMAEGKAAAVAAPKEVKHSPTTASVPSPMVRAGVDRTSWLHGSTSSVARANSATPSIPNVVSACSSTWPTEEEETALAPTGAKKQIQVLHTSLDAAQRVSAAQALARGEARKSAEVIDALSSTAKSDPAANVRMCCLRCLCALSREAPQAIMTINEMQADPDESIHQLAHSTIQELAQHALEKTGKSP